MPLPGVQFWTSPINIEHQAYAKGGEEGTHSTCVRVNFILLGGLLGPPQGMKNDFHSATALRLHAATALHESATLPFVIPSEAERAVLPTFRIAKIDPAETLRAQ
jgi:hypothetical protein